ncbi:GtrA family protein [Sphingobium sp. AN641]|uniref:GtrA family protein n=1 Tax=Sphingobium sp. AN641 TaxID=3133443 RepID=UPI0030BBD15D
MFDWKSPGEWKRLFRYYQAGVINMAFGYGLFALFVWAGMDMYVAQIVSHVLGVAFNYFTYSRYTFAGQPGSRMRFILSYAGNYVLNLATLALVATVVESPYIAGLIATIFVSVVNFFVLKRLVFSEKSA